MITLHNLATAIGQSLRLRQVEARTVNGALDEKRAKAAAQQLQAIAEQKRRREALQRTQP